MIYTDIPVIAVKDTVILPFNRMPIFVGREKSKKALEKAMEGDKYIFFTAQKNPKKDDPQFADIYSVGCVGKILQSIKDNSGGYKILIEGIERATLESLSDSDGPWTGNITALPLKLPVSPKTNALFEALIGEFKKYSELAGKIPKEIIDDILSINEPAKIIYLIIGYMPVRLAEKQKLLENNNPGDLVMKLIKMLVSEREFMLVKKDIHEKVHSKIQKNQREYFLSEEMKTIEQELNKNSPNKEYADYLKKIKEAGMPGAAKKQVEEELDRLSKMMPYSPESTVVRTYIDWMISMPWNKKTTDNMSIDNVQKVLEAEHWGLKKSKERVLEYLAVCKLNKKIKGPILCFTGPPGTGKTSFARSIARSMEREFVRISLGGVRDEAEIRGHRRTYIGSMPGKIIQSLRKAGSKNPVFLIDEIDKIGQDFRGDPSSALLEVLDPEQNNSFSDHYLDTPFDLSDIMFITTANTTYTIIPALKDRMEIIEFPSYTQPEKMGIAKNFLIPKQIKENGLTNYKISFTDSAVEYLIDSYTQEAGVRNLERQIATVLRKTARKLVQKKLKSPVKIDHQIVRELLGYEKHRHDEGKVNSVGIVCGLAWTEVGGEVISVETVLMKGKGNLILTGQLGEIMKESAQAAVSYLRANAKKLGIPENFMKNSDVHIHVPEGAIPKDGPSAGITIAISLVSAILKQPVRKDLAMTGEITLSGRVLPIGGLKEKALAAFREKIKTIIIPDKNKAEVEEFSDNVKKGLDIIAVKTIDEVIKAAIDRPARPKKKAEPESTGPEKVKASAHARA
ncbi:MAG: endopeptidase La [Elusimicrobia bacterium CG_4_10_14_3_um_filter_49_12_50_7]|nr:MAG: endopeptidase La [Elusimicrobia bacterium CG_4_10_14_3_um_filter_49_12_50_7]